MLKDFFIAIFLVISLMASFGCGKSSTEKPTENAAKTIETWAKIENLGKAGEDGVEITGMSQSDINDRFDETMKVMVKSFKEEYLLNDETATDLAKYLIDTLKKLYESLINYPKVVGIAIATRPDSLSDDVINYLGDLNKKTFLTIELGLQSSNDKTLDFIKRGHDVKCFADAVKKLKEKNIFVVAHIINGLPTDNEEDMLNTAKFLNNLNIDGIKIHMLYISKNTELAKIYEKEKFHILSKEEYIDITIKQLELLDEKIVIERITGDPVKEDLIEPTWLLKKFCVLNDIDKEMVKRNTYQGIYKKQC